MGNVKKLEELIHEGFFTEITAVPIATLQKILQGARGSRELCADKKGLLG